MTAAILVLALFLPGLARAAPHAAVVMDMRTGEILHARNHDTRLHPASLTKMMTLYIAFEAIGNGEITLDTPVRISANAAGQPCSCLGVRAGQTIALRYLIRAAALRSGNDAATAIGEAISGSEAAFIERMNHTARAMGLTNTTFRNAHGLTAPGHLSTARDMSLLGRQLFFDFPQYYNLFSRRSAHAGVATVPNTNRAFLDGYTGADGIKTGFTRAAGFNLTASAQRGDRRILVTLFGGASVPDRTRQVSRLMDMGFDRAPARAALRPPPAPNYGSQPPAGQALASAARTVRLETTVRRSPLPRPRPGATPAVEEAPMLVSLTADIAAAVAEAGRGAPPANAPAEVAAPPPRDIAASPFALAEPEPAPAAQPALPAVAAPAPRPATLESARAAAVTEALPFALAEGGEAPATGAPDLPFALVASEDAAAAVAQPPARPESVQAAALEAVAAATDATPTDTTPLAEPAESAAQAMAAAPPPPPRAEVTPESLSREGPPPTPAPPSGDVAVAAAPAADSPADEALELVAAEAAALVVLTFRPPAAGLEEAPRLASLADAGRAEAAGPTAPAAEGDVVPVQISTSDARMWAVSLGRYGTRNLAERALIRAALGDLSVLDGALRRVESRSGGFEARFVGLSAREAQIACHRLQARAQECSMLAP